jgi:hypothetical protein
MLRQKNHRHTHAVVCRQLKVGVATAFDLVHDVAKLKAAVVALHRSAVAKEAGRQAAPAAGGGGGGAAGDAAVAAAVMAEAGRSAHVALLPSEPAASMTWIQDVHVPCTDFEGKAPALEDSVRILSTDLARNGPALEHSVRILLTLDREGMVQRWSIPGVYSEATGAGPAAARDSAEHAGVQHLARTPSRQGKPCRVKIASQPSCWWFKQAAGVLPGAAGQAAAAGGVGGQGRPRPALAGPGAERGAACAAERPQKGLTHA